MKDGKIECISGKSDRFSWCLDGNFKVCFTLQNFHKNCFIKLLRDTRMNIVHWTNMRIKQWVVYSKNIMSIPLIIANILTVGAFFLHTFVGTYELKETKPPVEDNLKTEKWTLALCGWHWLSFDLFVASIVLTVFSFVDIPHESIYLQIISIIFLGYGVVWFFVVVFSDKFPNRFFKLPQWILLLVIGGLIWMACWLFVVYFKS